MRLLITCCQETVADIKALTSLRGDLVYRQQHIIINYKKKNKTMNNSNQNKNDKCTEANTVTHKKYGNVSNYRCFSVVCHLNYNH